MQKITDDNYKLYKKNFEIMWRFQCGLTDGVMDPDVENFPVNVLTSWEKANPFCTKGFERRTSGYVDRNNDEFVNYTKRTFKHSTHKQWTSFS